VAHGLLVHSRQFQWHTVAALTAALAILAFNLTNFDAVIDDAYISFRYLDNWLEGTGLVYNPGDRVEGYTNLLWIVALAPLRLSGFEPDKAAALISAAALGLLIWSVFATARTTCGRTEAGWAAVLLLAGSVSLARWATSGMETVLFASLLMLANHRLAVLGRHGWISSSCFGLATLARPEGLLFAGASFVVESLRRRRSAADLLRTLGAALVFIAFPASHTFFRMAYYGRPLPNTFYAKLTGDLPGLIPQGLDYLRAFVVPGGLILVAASALALRPRILRNWAVATMVVQIALHLAYVVRIGGDVFEFDRFIVPVIPLLAVIGGVGLSVAFRGPFRRRPAAVLAFLVALAIGQTAAGYSSQSSEAFRVLARVRAERELIAAWLVERLPRSTLLAVNAAGVIPYRTKMRTIDMLGLTDAHIARAPTRADRADGFTMIGHFKHDGNYVCKQRPGAVLTSGATLHAGRHAEEAIAQAALNTFPGDREFLRAEACRDRYRAVAQELEPGRFLVVYLPMTTAVPVEHAESLSDSAVVWFRRGLKLMQEARLEEAIAAFEKSLLLRPDHPAVLTNLGYCHLDLQRHQLAIAHFERALAQDASSFDALYGMALAYENAGERTRALAAWRDYIDRAPESVWKEKAREHLNLLSAP
jgi:tetratricopeptide (TPR) repeat protein